MGCPGGRLRLPTRCSSHRHSVSEGTPKHARNAHTTSPRRQTQQNRSKSALGSHSLGERRERQKSNRGKKKITWEKTCLLTGEKHLLAEGCNFLSLSPSPQKRLPQQCPARALASPQPRPQGPSLPAPHRGHPSPVGHPAGAAPPLTPTPAGTSPLHAASPVPCPPCRVTQLQLHA